MSNPSLSAVRDGLNFLTKLTPLRALNVAQVTSSYVLSRLTASGRPQARDLPVSRLST